MIPKGNQLIYPGDVKGLERQIEGLLCKKEPSNVQGTDLELLINFERYPEILEQVKKLSEEDLRSLNLQIIYMLREQLKPFLKDADREG